MKSFREKGEFELPSNAGQDKAVGLPLLLWYESEDSVQSLFTFEIILQWGEEVTNNGDTPGATQDFLPLHPAHVVHVRVVFGEAEDPKTVKMLKLRKII